MTPLLPLLPRGRSSCQVRMDSPLTAPHLKHVMINTPPSSFGQQRTKQQYPQDTNENQLQQCSQKSCGTACSAAIC